MSFKESIIIPLDVYQRCHLQSKTKETDILFNKSLPLDEKMKLFGQAQIEKKRKKRKKINSYISEMNKIIPLGDHILQAIPKQDKPIIKEILDIIVKHPSEISWNNNNEVIIDGRTLIKSNIIEMLLYMRKHLVVTKNGDIPEGIIPFYEKLLSLNIAPEWIKQKPPRTSRRIKKKKIPYEEEKELEKDYEINNDNKEDEEFHDDTYDDTYDETEMKYYSKDSKGNKRKLKQTPAKKKPIIEAKSSSHKISQSKKNKKSSPKQDKSSSSRKNIPHWDPFT
jgi:hypothetical protein